MGRVLILDDDRAVGETLSFVVEGAGMDVRAVTRPKDFFEAMRTWRPTHVILDLLMPEMDGVEVMRHLSGQGTPARIIILSGVGNRVLDAARRMAAEKGLHIIGVLSKPIRPADLRYLLENFEEREKKAAAIADAPHPNEAISADDLQRGIDAQEFLLVYQPKIRCADGTLAGFEALVRWQHPTRGLVMPDDFIPIAEREGLIGEITRQILAQGLHWLAAPGTSKELTLAVNLSARTLNELDFADRLSGLCRESGVAPNRLILELTETTAMEDPALALDLVTRLRMKGFHVSIDDVGTGYSSMAQLARLPFSEMKVDKSFVMTASQSQESRTIIESIIDLGHNLELRVAAEGVEDGSTLEFLAKAGCDYAQGFFIARPMEAERVGDWIDQRSAY